MGKDQENQGNEDIRDQKKVTRLSVILVILVFSIKLITAFFTNTMSFFAELTDSVVDFVAVFITYLALRESSKEADLRHMFGHYKINSFAALLQGLLILGLYGYIFYRSVILLVDFTQYRPTNSNAGAIALIITLLMVFFVSRYIIKIGKKTNNALILAQGINFRGDFYRNISVIIGLFLVSFGWSIIDLLLAIFFSIISILKAFGILKQSFYELTDSNIIDQHKVEKVEAQIKEIPGILLNSLQIRTLGNHLDVMVSVSIDEHNSMYRVSDLSNQIKYLIKTQFPEFATNVMTFFNPNFDLNKRGKNYLLDSIRMEGTKVAGITNIHQVSIDQFKDSILIQYHMQMDPQLSLQEAHTNSTILEDKIALKIRELIQDIEVVEVISHIEPATPQKKVHTHKVELSPELPEIKNKIQQTLCQFLEIHGINKIKAYSESDGLYLSIAIVLDPKSNVGDAHFTTQKAEHALYLAFPQLKRLLIHVEPERNSSDYIEVNCAPK